MDETTTEYIEEVETEPVTTVPELDFIMSQVSEINSYMAVTADNTADIKAQTEIEVILMFAVIGFIGVVCGLLGALTWRTNKNG